MSERFDIKPLGSQRWHELHETFRDREALLDKVRRPTLKGVNASHWARGAISQQIMWSQSNGLLTKDQAQSLLASAQAASGSIAKATKDLSVDTKLASNDLNTAINQLNALSRKIGDMLLTA